MIFKIIDYFFPRKCLICRQLSLEQVCPKCKPEATNAKQFEEDCFYLYKYTGTVKKIIHLIKFDKNKQLANLFSKELDSDFFLKYDLVIPVPCHFTRILSRGFFHLREMFDSVPGYRNDIVKRKKHTGVLFKKGKKERQKAMLGVFKVTKPQDVLDKKILIIDDIYTTGTTYKEMKKELEKYNPRKIEGLFLCRA